MEVTEQLFNQNESFGSNHTNRTSAFTHHDIDGFVIFYIILTALVSFSGTFGNILVIGAVLVHKKLRILSNVFIANLAVADLTVSAVINPFSLVGVLTKGEFFYKNAVLCQIIACFCIVSCTCSIWSIAAISINRYICICHRLLYHDMCTKGKTVFYVFSLWLICFAIDFPSFVGWGGHTFDTKADYCSYNYRANYSYTMYVIGFGYCIPMTLISYCYFRILIFARSVKKELNMITKSDDTKTPTGNTMIKQNDLRLLRSIATIWVVFMLMWTPYAAIVIFDFHGTWPRWFFIMAILLAHTNSSINCVIYAATNKNFREGYAIVLSLCCKKEMSGSSSVSSVNPRIKDTNL